MADTSGTINLQSETIRTLNRRLLDGEITARSLTQHCLEQITALNPHVNAVLETNPDALNIADRLDQELKASGPRSLLHGMPVLVKDNLDTADKMMTTAGSNALLGSYATKDSFVVKKLRDAGAIILGKTNLSEWANFRSPRSSSGWSSRGGQTRNAYALDRSPGGSSSGSAVAVATGLCVAAIGTETDGSIVSPSAMNSIVGIKPTVGSVSRSGIIPISHTQDTAGPMARCVEDAAVLLGIIAGEDADDAKTASFFNSYKMNTSEKLNSGGLKGIRIGLPRNYCGYNEHVDELVELAIESIISSGGVVVDNLELSPMSDIRSDETIVMSTEFKFGLNKYLSNSTQKSIRSLADLIAFNEKNAQDVMPYFRQEILEMSEEQGNLDDPIYLNALKECRRLSQEDGIDKLLTEHQLDAIITPTTCPPWLIDWVNGDNRSGGSACPAAVAGYPSITVPAGYVFGLPVGLSFFSSAGEEAKLINMAYAFEQESKIRKIPNMNLHVSFS